MKRAFLVADMPYASYHVGVKEAVRNATKFAKYGGAEAVKIEGGQKRIDVVNALVDAEIPVPDIVIGIGEIPGTEMTVVHEQ